MILIFFIIVLLAGGFLAWLFGKRNPLLSRIISLVAVGINLIVVLFIFIKSGGTLKNGWIIDYCVDWIPRFGIKLHFALDGLSLLMLTLTFFLGVISILISWKEITQNIGFFHFNILWILAGIVGVFLSMDLFLFYFFWELMLVPMYFLIGIWGHENRIYASYKFFIYTRRVV